MFDLPIQGLQANDLPIFHARSDRPSSHPKELAQGTTSFSDALERASARQPRAETDAEKKENSLGQQTAVERNRTEKKDDQSMRTAPVREHRMEQKQEADQDPADAAQAATQAVAAGASPAAQLNAVKTPAPGETPENEVKVTVSWTCSGGDLEVSVHGLPDELASAFLSAWDNGTGAAQTATLGIAKQPVDLALDKNSFESLSHDSVELTLKLPADPADVMKGMNEIVALIQSFTEVLQKNASMTEVLQKNPSTITDALQTNASMMTEVLQKNPSTITDALQKNGLMTDALQKNPSTMTEVLQTNASMMTDALQKNPSTMTEVLQTNASMMTDALQKNGLMTVKLRAGQVPVISPEVDDLLANLSLKDAPTNDASARQVLTGTFKDLVSGSSVQSAQATTNGQDGLNGLNVVPGSLSESKLPQGTDLTESLLSKAKVTISIPGVAEGANEASEKGAEPPSEGSGNNGFTQQGASMQATMRRQESGPQGSNAASFGSIVADRLAAVAEQVGLRDKPLDITLRLKMEGGESLLVGLKDQAGRVLIHIRCADENVVSLLESQKETIARHLEAKQISARISVSPIEEDVTKRQGREQPKNMWGRRYQPFSPYAETSI